MAYDAFISYSQAEDVRIATAIQDGLHKFAKQWNDLSSLRVFRDRSNMQLKSILPSLKEALSETRYLIYLACPAAAKSEWVQNELKTFLDNNEEHSILIVLTKGELIWNSAIGRFEPGELSAFPQLHKNYFSNEPLFLDMRWAAEEKDLSLSNPKFLDAVATIAATLKNIPKDKLSGTHVEEQKRLHRNQRINMGFRGAFGFGIGPFLLFLMAMIFSFVADTLFSKPNMGYYFLLIGFPAAGMIGALSCGVGRKGTIGFILSFLLLLPFYLMATMLPNSNAWGDYTLLALLTIGAFSLVGITGAAFSNEIQWQTGVTPFRWGGIAAMLTFLLIRTVLPRGIDAPIVSDVWFPIRISILTSRAIQIGEGIFSERYYATLIPLVFSCTLSGFLFGLKLADTRVRLPLKTKSRFGVPNQWKRFLRSKFCKIFLIIVFLAAISWWSYTLTNSHQTNTSLNFIKKEVPKFTFEAANYEYWENDFLTALRCRRILRNYGFHSEAADLSSRIRQGIRLFGSSSNLFFNKNHFTDYPQERFALIAGYFKQLGEPDELDRLLNIAHETVNNGSVEAMIEVGRIENLHGHHLEALETFHKVELKLEKDDIYEKSFLAQCYYENGNIEVATKLLRSISNYVMMGEETRPIDFSDNLFPASGEAFWKTGVWRDLQEWKSEVGVVHSEIVASMCRDGELALALSLLKEYRRSTGFWHVQHSKLAKAAAEVERYSIAFTVLDSLRNTENPSWGDYSDEADGLVEILKVQKIHYDESVRKQALERLKLLELRIQNANLLDRFTGNPLCYAYALAGEDSMALSLAAKLTDEKWDAYRMIAPEVASRDKSLCQWLLKQSWKEMYKDSYKIEGGEPAANQELSEIVSILVDIGEYHKARTIASGRDSELEACLLILEAKIRNSTPAKRHLQCRFKHSRIYNSAPALLINPKTH